MSGVVGSIGRNFACWGETPAVDPLHLVEAAVLEHPSIGPTIHDAFVKSDKNT